MERHHRETSRTPKLQQKFQKNQKRRGKIHVLNAQQQLELNEYQK